MMLPIRFRPGRRTDCAVSAPRLAAAAGAARRCIRHAARTAFLRLPALLRPDDLLVMNDTRVIKARPFGHKESGGKVELLVERVLDEHDALAFIRASHAPRPGSRIRLADDVAAEVLARQDDLTRLRFPRPVLDVLDQLGQLPLPPYIEHTPTADDEARYQTVYANAPGGGGGPHRRTAFSDAGKAGRALRAQGVGSGAVDAARGRLAPSTVQGGRHCRPQDA